MMPMIRFLFIFLALSSQHVYAQQTRSLTVDLSLDVGIVERTLPLQVRVTNHTLVVISIFPFIALRPITSERSVQLELPSGAGQITALIDGISTDTVSHRVEITCLGCADTVPTQFYRAEGNTTSMPASVFINPQDLPTQVTSRLITLAQISGRLSLLPSQVNEEELEFEIAAVDSVTGSIIGSQLVLLPAGENFVDYQLRGLSRQINNLLEIRARCISCAGIFPLFQSFPQTLSTQSDSQSIDFLFDAEPSFKLNGVLYLILGNT